MDRGRQGKGNEIDRGVDRDREGQEGERDTGRATQEREGGRDGETSPDKSPYQADSQSTTADTPVAFQQTCFPR